MEVEGGGTGFTYIVLLYTCSVTCTVSSCTYTPCIPHPWRNTCHRTQCGHSTWTVWELFWLISHITCCQVPHTVPTHRGNQVYHIGDQLNCPWALCQGDCSQGQWKMWSHFQDFEGNWLSRGNQHHQGSREEDGFPCHQAEEVRRKIKHWQEEE